MHTVDSTIYAHLFKAYLIFLSIIIGLVFGSFGNAWAYRIVHNEKISKGRSHCPVCGHVLSARDLVPLLSYLFSGGKCRYCKAKISARYPVSEAVTAAVFAGLLVKFGISPGTFFLWGFGFFLMVLSFVDWESMIIPDSLLIAAGVCGILFRLSTGGLSIAGLIQTLLAGFVLAGGLLIIVLFADKILKKETMGGGDIKLVFVIGLTLGIWAGLLSIFLACIIGLIFALLPGARGRQGEDAKAFPFVPSLAIATFLSLLIGDYFIAWYSGFFTYNL